MQGIFLSDRSEHSLVLDPRTKLFAMLTVVIFILSGFGIHLPEWLKIFFCLMPTILLLTAGRWQRSLMYGIIFGIAECIIFVFSDKLHGGFGYIIMMICLVIQRILPGLIMGAYIFASTTVSEFIAAMQKMHITDKVTIPISVMFRFFPTVMEEFFSINSAMKMRDIRIGAGNAGKLVEYRLVPLMICSAKIGEELSQAALTRGLAPGRPRTNICKIGFAFPDIVLFLICICPYVIYFLEKVGVAL